VFDATGAVTIQNNSLSAGGYGVYLAATNSAAITGNQIFGNTNSGLYLGAMLYWGIGFGVYGYFITSFVQDANMLKHPNVVVMRGVGYNLGHELAMLHRSNLFIGTSSGFAAAAAAGRPRRHA
jgi:hypothetical protein